MAHREAGHDSAEGEQHHLPGRQEPPYTFGLVGQQLRWVCGAGPQPVEVEEPPDDEWVDGGRGDSDAWSDTDGVDDEDDWRDQDRCEVVQEGLGKAVRPRPGVASSCRTEHEGWAGAHRHGAVRPRSRRSRRERPPGRWC